MSSKEPNQKEELRTESTNASDTASPATPVLKTSAFGTKTIFGGGKVALWSVSFFVGIAIGLLTGVVAFLMRKPTQFNDWTFVILMAILVGGCSVCFCWIALVDRTTITGAIPHPEENVEDAWRTKAMAAALIGILFANVILVMLVAFYDKPIPATTAAGALLILEIVGIVTGTCSYFIFRKKDTE
ncbi:hypothetical protein OZX74_04445 [Bifidobacterium sp. ESL0798]|uniref:hypothetical protein n=1 Tax=Bifidobacterium sp. ESL0798 TaxID=2983235 RepID=UPI0023F9CA6C|nr:hypothetical protein [Bifidobacterium sp. ESL0798]WEV74767.1 hypothetical protein OZX74_04445 [Bifidobacterium sp. ESL0798]